MLGVHSLPQCDRGCLPAVLKKLFSNVRKGPSAGWDQSLDWRNGSGGMVLTQLCWPRPFSECACGPRLDTSAVWGLMVDHLQHPGRQGLCWAGTESRPAGQAWPFPVLPEALLSAFLSL